MKSNLFREEKIGTLELRRAKGKKNMSIQRTKDIKKRLYARIRAQRNAKMASAKNPARQSPN